MAATSVVDGPAIRVDASPRLRPEIADALLGTHNKAEQARRLGLTRTHWARIRNGEITPTLETAMRIASVTGTSVEALFGRAA